MVLSCVTAIFQSIYYNNNNIIVRNMRLCVLWYFRLTTALCIVLYVLLLLSIELRFI